MQSVDCQLKTTVYRQN